MKNKKILIILLLAVLVTGGSWFVEWRSITCRVVTCIGVNTFCRGFPLTFVIDYQPSRYARNEIGSCDNLLGQAEWMSLPFILDLLFWFFVLAFGSWVAKKLKLKI